MGGATKELEGIEGAELLVMKKRRPNAFSRILIIAFLLGVTPFDGVFSFDNERSASPPGDGVYARKCSQRILRRIESSHPDETVTIWIFFTDYGDSPGPIDAGTSRTVSESPRASRRVRFRGSPDSDRERLQAVFPGYIETVSSHVIRLRRASMYFNAVSAIVKYSEIEAICSYPFVKMIREVAVYRRELPREADRTIENPVRNHLGTSSSTQYGESIYQLSQIQANELLELGYNGSGTETGSSPILIGILDTGFRRDHEALEHVNVVAEYDFIQDDTVTSNEDGDHPSQDMHGTTVLGTIAGYHEGDLIGPAWGAGYLLAKTEIYDQEIEIEEDNWVAAIEWADGIGADVVTSSVGYILWYTPDSLDGNTALCTRAADIAVSRGIVVVNSAGNYGYGGLIAPADGHYVTTVGGVNRYGELFASSSRGPTADGRIKPEVVAMAVNVHTVMQPPSQTEYWSYSGTSYAAPLVAGLCAQLLEIHPDWGPLDLREVLLCTSTRHNYPDNDFGYGIPQGYLASGLGEEPDVLIIGYPNPFRDSVSFEFCPYFTNPVRSDIYNVRGTLIKTLFGERGVTWDGTNDSGRSVAGGVYFIVFRFRTYKKSLKILRVP